MQSAKQKRGNNSDKLESLLEDRPRAAKPSGRTDSSPFTFALITPHFALCSIWSTITIELPKNPSGPGFSPPQSLGDWGASGEDSDPLPHGDFWDIWTTMEKQLSLRVSSGLSLADMTAQTGMDRAALFR